MKTEINYFAALESLLPASQCGEFMFMYEAPHGSRTVYAYKHTMTRRYLLADTEGNTYNSDGRGAYVPSIPAVSIAHARNA